VLGREGELADSYSVEFRCEEKITEHEVIEMIIAPALTAVERDGL